MNWLSRSAVPASVGCLSAGPLPRLGRASAMAAAAAILSFLDYVLRSIDPAILAHTGTVVVLL